MKTLFSIRAFRNYLLTAVALFLLAAAIIPAHAQNTAAADPVDVSTFPGRDKLPGKVPPTVWTGLTGEWARNHARWKTSASNDVGAVVFLGDSITQGWATLAKDFPNLKVANRGIGGDVTGGVLYRLQSDVLSLKPAAVVLLIGINDLGNNLAPADTADNVKAILTAIKKSNPGLEVIVCKTMPRGGANEASDAEKIQKLNGLVADFVKTEPNFVVCDTYSPFLDSQGHQSAANFNTDRLHLNAAGYAVWKKALDPVIAKLNITTAK